MEHLFYRDGDDRKNFGSILPTTRWLFFDHQSNPLTDFHSYLPARGWNTSKIWDGYLVDAHPSLANLPHSEITKSVAAALQNWLFLGLLEAALQKRAPVQNFVRDNNIYTLRLAIYFRSWKTSATLLLKDVAEQKRWNGRTVDALTEANVWCRRISRWIEPAADCPTTARLHEGFPGFAEMIAESIPTIVRVAEAIEFGRQWVFRACDDIYPGLNWPCPSTMAAERRARLLSRGWCPFVVNLLQCTLRQSTLDWMDTTGKVYPPADHSGCTLHECARNNANLETYRTQHVDPDCCCAFVKPSLEDMIAIFEQGSIPIIRVIEKDGDEVGLDVSPASSDSLYVAFSHVWVDGLGSVSEDGIPTCQALRLSRLASKALNSPGAALWIDSICIPRQRQWRRQAIISLYRTYQDSAAVVVIDRTIRNLKMETGTTDPESLILSIYSSPWMQRLWTYQESLLAKKLIFELSDGLLHFGTSSIPRSKMPDTMQLVWHDLGKEIFRLQHQQTVKLNVGHMARALSWRSTTRSDDETIAIASVLGLDVARLISLDGDIRKMMFWRLVKNVPYNIIFVNRPRLSVKPFRWAPDSLMTREGIRLDTDDSAQTSLCTDAGLVGNYLVLKLKGYLGGGTSYMVEPHRRVVFWLHQTPGLSKSSLGLFDIVAINSEFKTIPKPSKYTTAAALKQRPQNHPGSGVLMCDYVGPVVLECMELNNIYGTKSQTVSCTAEVVDLCIR
ncbi:hypothetical protein BDD12DRAFT_908834 [Trichophaea hybrida]|nr:hypothetical protein BDD12DRAFT_908834 [Trichophaea hybrida]